MALLLSAKGGDFTRLELSLLVLIYGLEMASLLTWQSIGEQLETCVAIRAPLFDQVVVVRDKMDWEGKLC